ncbi:hypothetical protein M569_10078, partial [Genlisea aurea]
SAAPILGLDSFLAQQFRRDPFARNDSFLSLPSSLKSNLLHSSSLHPPSPDSLLSFDLPIPLTVHLVGSTFSPSSPSLLASFVNSALTAGLFHVITPFSGAPHHLSLSHSLQLSASLSPGNLADSLSKALDSHLSAAPAAFRYPLTAVPHSIVDDLILQDLDKQKPTNSFHIYVLHLGHRNKPYAYSYTASDISPGHTNCLGSIWTGKERYLWIDLGAGPVDYGPALSGDGVLPKGEFHPFAALHGRPKSEKSLVSEVASLICSAYQVLLVPSLRISVPYEDTLIIELIHIHGDAASSSGIDWNSVEKTFLDEIDQKGLLLSDQKLSFMKYEIDFSHCSICSYAVSRSTTSYTSRYLFDNYTLIVSEYLDSKRLHQSISESVEEFRKVGNLPEVEFGRVIPVYIFDLDLSSVLLLDRYHQTVAFKDMVIAVRTLSSQTVSDYSCNGNHVFTTLRQLERPIVGSILQTMWGVSPTHVVWSSRHNGSLVDYTWSVGQTPFGPFSESSSLSFVQREAARRNVVLTALNDSITRGMDVLESVWAYGGDRRLLKDGSRRSEFLQRWMLFRYKLEKSVSAMSHFDYEKAVYYVRSSDHDMYALHSVVYRATREMEASLVCFKEPPFPWGGLGVSVGVLGCFVLGYAKRDKLFQDKKKQF